MENNNYRIINGVPMQNATFGGAKREFISSAYLRQEMNNNLREAVMSEETIRVLNKCMQIAPAISTHVAKTEN